MSGHEQQALSHCKCLLETEQPGLVAAAAVFAARASQRLRVRGFIGGMGIAATKRPPKVSLALPAKPGPSPYLGRRTYRSKGRLHYCCNYYSLLGAIKPASVPGMKYLPLSEQGVMSQNPVTSLSWIPSLPAPDAGQYQVLSISPLILSSTPKGKCYYPCFTDEENKGEESTGRSFESEFAVEPGFKLRFPGLRRQCSPCYSHSHSSVQALSGLTSSGLSNLND